MPLTTRVAQLRQFLVPPLRAPLRPSSLHRCLQIDPASVRAGPVSVHVVPCRPLHLYKTARAKTTLGQHKVLTFNTYDVASPSASQHTVDLVEGNRIVAKNITLQELYDNHVKSGHMLYLTELVKKGKAQNLGRLKTDLPLGTARTFAICKAHSTFAQISKKKTASGWDGSFGPLKTLNLNLSSPPHYAQIQLDRAYRFIESGSPVEFRIRFSGTQLSRAARLEPGDPDVWPWMHDHFPHLRPDFIIRGMPPGTFFLIQPVSDHRIVQFVMARKVANMPQTDLLKRLFKVKRSVQESIKDGRQAQLPRLMRQRLQDRGQSEYSERTSLPQPRLHEKYGVEHPGMAGIEGVGAQEDVSEQRYLFPTAKAARKAWIERTQTRLRDVEVQTLEETNKLEQLQRSSAVSKRKARMANPLK